MLTCTIGVVQFTVDTYVICGKNPNANWWIFSDEDSTTLHCGHVTCHELNKHPHQAKPKCIINKHHLYCVPVWFQWPLDYSDKGTKPWYLARKIICTGSGRFIVILHLWVYLKNWKSNSKSWKPEAKSCDWKLSACTLTFQSSCEPFSCSSVG